MVFLTNFLEIRGHSLLVKEMLEQLKESIRPSGDPSDRESGLQALLHRETSKVCVCVCVCVCVYECVCVCVYVSCTQHTCTHAHMHTNYS